MNFLEAVSKNDLVKAKTAYQVDIPIETLRQAILLAISNKFYVMLEWLIDLYWYKIGYDEDDNDLISKLSNQLYSQLLPTNLSKENWTTLFKDIYFPYQDGFMSDYEKTLITEYRKLAKKYPLFSFDDAFIAVDANATYDQIKEYILYHIFDPHTRLLLAYFNKNIKVSRYPQTERPITDMAFATNNCTIEGLWFPIVRYDNLYYKYDEDYCGTFYYFEPDSTNYLNLGKTLIAANKIHAYILLFSKQDELESIRTGTPIGGILAHSIITFINGGRLQDSDLTRKVKFYDLYLPILNYLTTVYNKENDIINVRLINRNGLLEDAKGNYEPKIAKGSFFAGFDELDQIICQEARKQNYDTILLQREPGLTRMVTEILDTRDRSISYSNICKQKYNYLPIKAKYPTIWVSEYGFIEF
jgi:hypothetical protein